ncbi:MAG: DUF4159 domain-containing protein [Acidobacteriota bacterium]|nr:DUF4159 domain-containing protein [Acidobacteriota bacterium]MDP9115515.1 DUF4159 domain-containing protein [Acidobacteriota bacterium]
MRFRIATLAVPLCFMTLCGFSALLAFQAGFKEYTGEEDNPAAVPKDAHEATEWTFARLRYPSGRYAGYSGERGSWPTDFPKADRQFLQGVRRLTRIHARSTEQVIDLINDPQEIFNWPWVYAVEVGHWDLTDNQCQLLREYLLRGGFLMVDDFHGTFEWDVFTQGMSRVFPERPIVELPAADPIFHTVYDLDRRVQVPGLQYLYSGRICEKCEAGGAIPHWRGIYDDAGRVMVAMCFNQDDGDAWEHADNPHYEAKYTSQAYRLGIDYVMYSMTH